MGRSTKLAALVAAASGIFAGCYHGTARSVAPAELHRDSDWVMVDGVQPVRQSADSDCGAAALAMVLGRWGAPASSRAEIAKSIPDAAKGIPAGALRDFARRRGLQAFLINGELDDLLREVRRNNPVLVGLVQLYGDKAYSHYEVVLGVNPRARRVLVFDPAHGPREDGFEGFSAEWDRARRLTIIVDGAPTRIPG